jgi:beta-lactamase superfamily II metal-dependent hydrolase
MPRHRRKAIDIASALIIFALVLSNIFVWKNIIISVVSAADKKKDLSGIYFLPVTEGESSLLVAPGGMTVLTDAGSDGAIVDTLQKIMPPDAGSYIDLAVISYPESADYGGYEYLLEHYKVGAFLYNGRDDIAHSTEWQKLAGMITSRHIPLITLDAGDRIVYGKDAEIDILSPDDAFVRSPAPEETGIVQRVITPKFTALLAADIDANVVSALLAAGRHPHTNLRASILKAPFPGLGSADGDAFLDAIQPRTIVILPGVKGSPNQPTKAMLAHLASSTKAAVVPVGHATFLLYNK